MDEEQYEALLNQIDAMDPLLNHVETVEWDEILSEQLRDGDGHRVPGCYRVLPAHTYG